MATSQEPNIAIRMVLMLLDHMIMTFVVVIFFIPTIISGILEIQSPHETVRPDIFEGFSYFGLLGFALYFCKDGINGRSPAKRILKFQIVEISGNKVASPLRCFVRNMFCIIWPIEVIIALANPKRRLGDRVAGTKLIVFDSEFDQPSPNYVQLGISFVLAYVFMLSILKILE